jgi:S-adenosylmethionine:tRNA ribosyltransferase-isomerase
VLRDASHPAAGDIPDLRRTDAYDYVLPPGRIARYPTERRDASRLLGISRDGERDVSSLPHPTDRHFSDLPDLIAAGDLLVLNESRVIPFRLLGRGSSGGEREILLLRPAPGEGEVTSAHRWEALVRPGAKLRPGREVVISPDLRVIVEESHPDGHRIVRLETPYPVEEILEREGHIPLPPYLERGDEAVDLERYQTVYARTPGSAAAPTAGLHFTPELLHDIQKKGVGVAWVTLHVGPGTFRPVDSEAIGEHVMHGERWKLPIETAAAIRETRLRGGRVWAVGTTVVRTLESAAGGEGEGGDAIAREDDNFFLADEGETHLFISPGYRFRVVDALITNFHLPRSTLLMLVSAFAGYRTTMSAYAHAIESGYRFYSYGDAMAILPEGPR